MNQSERILESSAIHGQNLVIRVEDDPVNKSGQIHQCLFWNPFELASIGPKLVNVDDSGLGTCSQIFAVFAGSACLGDGQSCALDTTVIMKD